LEPLERIVANSLKSRDPAVNDRGLLAAWRSFALALLEYRRGEFEAALSELQRCSEYPGQSPACVAGTHLLLSMALRQSGKIDQADAELQLGRAMVEDRFQKKLEMGDNKIGKIQGWIETPIFLHEAEALASSAAWLRSDSE
jgi:hypothetical protein